MEETSSFQFSVISFVRKNLLVLVLASLGFLFIGIGFFQLVLPKKEEIEFTPHEEVEAKTEEKQITVDVAGAVKNPGVYSFDSDTRIQDALVAAGGLSQEANREYVSKQVNLAQKLVDGVKIYIPTKDEKPEPQAQIAGVTTNGTVNINSASATELDTLPGVGKVTAEKIINGRPYQSVEELLTKKIVGSSVFEKIKDKVSTL